MATDSGPGGPSAVVGCLLDVSGSMRQALEPGRSDRPAAERLHAVLRAALKLAQAEEKRSPDAFMFVAVFGLQSETGGPPSVDLCAVVDALLGNGNDDDGRSGHDLLVALANRNNLDHITEYIRTKLTDQEARIVHTHLQRHRSKVDEFVQAIPTAQKLQDVRAGSTWAGSGAGVFLGCIAGAVLFGPIGLIITIAMVAGAGGVGGRIFANTAIDRAVDDSKGLNLARKMCNEWLLDFVDFVPRRISDVVRLLQRLQDRKSTGDAAGTNGDDSDDTVLETLRRYMYGYTPMRDALLRSTAAFEGYSTAKQRVLVLVSDGSSSDGDPLPYALELRESGVTMATVYLTDDEEMPRRQLYDRNTGWDSGRRKLFDMASRMDCAKNPVPVLTSVGWTIPSSGECALYATVCSVSVLEEFCSMLLTARFGSADALLDMAGRVQIDAYINDKHAEVRRRPSHQRGSETCYAHATAAVIHMALCRIEGREGGYPSIREIRSRILTEFPALPGGRNTEEVLRKAVTWYRPRLRVEPVDEDGARQAVLRRRPVLARFRLSSSGWKVFNDYFTADDTRRFALARDHMAFHRQPPDDGGHAVVMTACSPDSITFLNSQGSDWGDGGSFSVEDHTVLELASASGVNRMQFYDVLWDEEALTPSERQAFQTKVDDEVARRSQKYPSLLELEVRCPRCRGNAPVADFKGSIRRAVCPLCRDAFQPEPGYLVQALYARAGLREVT